MTFPKNQFKIFTFFTCLINNVTIFADEKYITT